MSRFYDELRLSSFEAGTGASLCFGGRVRIRASCGICSRLRSHRRVADQATIPRNGASDPTGLIANPRLHTRVCRGVCSDIRGRSSNRSIPGFIPICGALVELPFEPACIGAAVVVVV